MNSPRKALTALKVASVCLLMISHPFPTQSQTVRSSQEQISSSLNVAQTLSAAKAYLYGTVGLPDYAKAFQLFQQASEDGSVEANAWLGNMYLRGLGVAKDDSKATALIVNAASQGDPVGLRFEGAMYQLGLAVSQDLTKAKAFYEQAAAKGDGVSYGRLGMMYVLGAGVQQDRSRGVELLKKGSSAGDLWSKVELGRVYMTSQNSADKPLAVAEYTQAAAAGNSVAEFRLGRIYEFGLAGQKVDVQRAAQLYLQAVAKWHPYAQFRLARLYMTGNGVEVNDISAYELLTLASGQGVNEADVYLRQLSRSMTPDQIAQASALVEKAYAAGASKILSPATERPE
jgi:TPR repeat protein